jgi:hypothetical protein
MIKEKEKEKEILFFHSKDESLITFEFEEKMLILLSDKMNTTEITLDKNSIQILKDFINRLELKDSNINLNNYEN